MNETMLNIALMYMIILCFSTFIGLMISIYLDKKKVNK